MYLGCSIISLKLVQSERCKYTGWSSAAVKAKCSFPAGVFFMNDISCSVSGSNLCSVLIR